jgi:hypothetical protein
MINQEGKMDNPNKPGKNNTLTDVCEHNTPINVVCRECTAMVRDIAPDVTSQKGSPKKGGVKHDSEKVRLDLIPVLPHLAVARVLTHGARNYGEWNWAQGLKYSRCIAACERHIAEFKAGGYADNETKEHILAHAICELMFLLHFELSGQGAAMKLDNRYYLTGMDIPGTMVVKRG